MQQTAHAVLPVLYSFRRCPYAMRTRLGLAASDQTCELREVVLANKPAELLQASGKATVPVLVLPSAQVIDQSLDIMLWALQRNDPHHWLPQEDADIQSALQLVAQCDGAFKFHLDRYKYPTRFGLANGLARIFHRNK
jgi:glutathione S-transferase